MPRLPVLKPGRDFRLGSDAASLELFDELRLCGALAEVETQKSADGSVTYPVFGVKIADPREPLGYWLRVQFGHGRFRRSSHH